MKKAKVGSISWGTMRAEDLIPVFMKELKELNPRLAEKIQLDVDKLNLVHSPDYGSYYDDQDDIDGLSSQELASYILNEDLFDALDAQSPNNCYFGAHPGDGADYGFWPTEE